MLHSAYIMKLRNKLGDTPRRVHVDWTGDGTTSAFQMPKDTYPVLDQTADYVIKVNSVVMTETTQFTLDKTSGLLSLVSTPTNGQAITIDCSAVHLRDADWILVIADVIRSLGDDFFKDFVDTSLTTTAEMLSLSLVSAQPNCIAVYELAHRSSTSDDWTPVENFANWRYDRDNNILYFGSQDSFPVTSELIKVRGLKTYTIGTAITDTLDVQDRFLTVLDAGCEERYWQWRYKDVVELVSKESTEGSRARIEELIMLSDRARRLYEAERTKLKPSKPPRNIPNFIHGQGRP